MNPTDLLEHQLPFEKLSINDFARGVKSATEFFGKNTNYVTLEALSIVFNTPDWIDLKKEGTFLNKLLSDEEFLLDSGELNN